MAHGAIGARARVSLTTRRACLFLLAASEAAVVHRACDDVASSAAGSALAHGAISALDARSMALHHLPHVALALLAFAAWEAIVTLPGTLRYRRARCGLDGISSLPHVTLAHARLLRVKPSSCTAHSIQWRCISAAA